MTIRWAYHQKMPEASDKGSQPFYPKSVIRIYRCYMAVRNPNDRFGIKVTTFIRPTNHV